MFDSQNKSVMNLQKKWVQFCMQLGQANENTEATFFV